LQIRDADAATPDESTGASGSANSGSAGVPTFQQIYSEIANSNKLAQSKNGTQNAGPHIQHNATQDTDAATPDATAQSLLASELIKELSNPTSDALGVGLEASGSADTLAQANSLLQQAIVTVSQTLNLKVQDGIENITLGAPSQNAINQFAQMISALKGISSALDDAAASGQPVEYGTTTFDAQQVGDVEKTVQQQLFNIELALKMSGLSGEVSNAVAQLDNNPVMNGIAQAANPSTLSTPAIYVRQMLGQQNVTSEQKAQGLFSSLVTALQAKGTADSSEMLKQVASIATGSTVSNTAPDLGSADGQVLRKLLDIDNSGSTTASALENGLAADRSAKLGLPASSGITLSAELKTVEAIGAKSKDVSDAAQMAMADVKTDGVATQPVDAKAVEDPVPKQLEDSVMSQVADKLTFAAKSGITEMRILLRPESLGEVQLRIRMDGDVVMGKIYVENQQVKHIVESNLNVLKDALAQHNIQTGSFDVNVNHGNDTRDQMQMMAELAAIAGRNGGKSANGGDESNAGAGSVQSTAASGVDTGRRFGGNTIELFA
jgi:flagellar hook-length control protein FliK